MSKVINRPQPLAGPVAVIHGQRVDIGIPGIRKVDRPAECTDSGRWQCFVRTGVEVRSDVVDRDNSRRCLRIAGAESELRQAIIDADRVRQSAITEARQAWVNLDAQRHIVAAYFWFFPFSWWSTNWGLFWPDTPLDWLPLSISVILVIEVGRMVYARRAAEK